MASLSLFTAPTYEPVTLADAKSHLREDSTNDQVEADIAGLIVVARRWVERECGLALCTQVWNYKLDCFPACGGEIRIPLAPVSAIGSITYLDEDGASATMPASDYVLDGAERYTRVVLAPEASWPITEYGRVNAVTIRFTAGYGSEDLVPAELKHAIKLIVGQLYAYRELEAERAVAKLGFTLDALLADYRVWH